MQTPAVLPSQTKKRHEPHEAQNVGVYAPVKRQRTVRAVTPDVIEAEFRKANDGSEESAEWLDENLVRYCTRWPTVVRRMADEIPALRSALLVALRRFCDDISTLRTLAGCFPESMNDGGQHLAIGITRKGMQQPVEAWRAKVRMLVNRFDSVRSLAVVLIMNQDEYTSVLLISDSPTPGAVAESFQKHVPARFVPEILGLRLLRARDQIGIQIPPATPENSRNILRLAWSRKRTLEWFISLCCRHNLHVEAEPLAEDLSKMDKAWKNFVDKRGHAYVDRLFAKMVAKGIESPKVVLGPYPTFCTSHVEILSVLFRHIPHRIDMAQ